MSDDDDKTQSPLQRLPAELRNRIFQHATSAERKDDRMVVLNTDDYHALRRRLLNISLTCRAFREQTLPLFFGNNIFRSSAIQTCKTPAGKDLCAEVPPLLRGVDQRPATKAAAVARNTSNHVFVYYGFGQDLRTSIYQCYLIEMPHPRFRKLIRHLELDLSIPEELGLLAYIHHDVPYREIDWLYPVRELVRLGFTDLVSMKVRVRCRPGIDHKSYSGKKVQIMKWVDAQMQAMQLPRALEVVYVDEK